MPDKSFADLLAEAGIQPSAATQYAQSLQRPVPYRNYTPPRPMPRTMRPPEARMFDQNPGVQQQAAAQIRRQNAVGQDAMLREAQGPANNQFADAGMVALETTGIPAIRRSYDAFEAGKPREGIYEGIWGGLGLAGTLGAIPGRGRVPRSPMREPVLPTMREASAPPPGSVLPVRPRQPFRQSLIGGSDDLSGASRGVFSEDPPDGMPRPAPDAGPSGEPPPSAASGAEQMPRGTQAAGGVRDTSREIPLQSGEVLNFRAVESNPSLREIHWDIRDVRGYGEDVEALMNAELAIRRRLDFTPGLRQTPEGADLQRQVSDLARRRLEAQASGGDQRARQSYVPAFRAVERALIEELDANAGRGVTFMFWPDKAGLEPIYAAWARRFSHPNYRVEKAEIGYRIVPTDRAPTAPDGMPRRAPDAGPSGEPPPSAASGGETLGATPFYRGAVHDVDTTKGPNNAAFFTTSREHAGEFPRSVSPEQRQVREYRLPEGRLADFRDPATRERVLAQLADDPDAASHLQRRIGQMGDKASGHIDWVISSDPAIRNAIERAGYAGVWLDEGRGQSSVAVFRNQDIRPAPPDGSTVRPDTSKSYRPGPAKRGLFSFRRGLSG